MSAFGNKDKRNGALETKGQNIRNGDEIIKHLDQEFKK